MMKMVLVRVDDRLIHGQVAVGWTRFVGGTCILVVDDEVAQDNTQKMLLKMSTPVGVKSSVVSIADAAAQLAAGKFRNEKLIIIVRGPQALLGLIEGGVALPKINIGNVRMTEGRERLTKEVAATPDEIEAWRKLDAAGLELEALWLPGGSATNFNQIIRSYTK
ncbi:PTS system mannose/fructose/N-acetylgalactosamine-transporter subunit IIB [Paenibacillus thalictri]|uniref:PTS mannose/fructose/sorbose transporter subunit IIB n=1 Tax=Paenibacillus thalictri TaxID=2527873 RepID=A0A4Q9DFI9_9BACL|nr:PTS sugar transporter subunit IIB [Paenibacillus thalictri]TBL70096.1 PTS mannose/fructose/sorbose transporter subunit IIB [Paenibacillus thalictri]